MLSDPPTTRQLRLHEVFACGSRSFSFEFFPPKDDAGESQLWTAVGSSSR